MTPTARDWKVTTTPTTWLRDLVLWYSRVLVAEMGAERFGKYVADFDYGNADISGDPGRTTACCVRGSTRRC